MDQIAATARILSEALPFLQRYDDQIIVVKYGGHAMGEDAVAKKFAGDAVLLGRLAVLNEATAVLHTIATAEGIHPFQAYLELCRLVGALARDSGLDGMVGGQLFDLAAEGRFEAAAAPLDLVAIRHLQSLKTGAEAFAWNWIWSVR